MFSRLTHTHTNVIIPLHKKSRPTKVNHYQPVALKSLTIKYLDKVLLNTILPIFNPHLDSTNSIQRHLMILTLYHLYIPTQLIFLIRSFLSNRQQVVMLGSSKSPPLNINTGAPQGCVLNPFLYTLYTNDSTSLI